MTGLGHVALRPHRPTTARVARPASTATRRDRLILIVVIVACAAAILRTLLLDSFDGPWVPVARALDYTADPPWNHRVMFVWLANAVRALRPGTTPFEAYFVSQAVATLLALGCVAQWASHAVPRRDVWLAPVLVTFILIPTITYRTFFDIGIIAVFALALTLLFRRRIGAYTLVLGAGTLNHEITALLIPLFLGFYWDRALSRRWLIRWAAIQLALWTAVRAALFQALPSPALWQSGKLEYNLDLIFHLRPGLVTGMSVILLWLLLAALAWPRITSELRRCLWLLPGLVVTTLCVGQLNEPRQFDAFLPALAAMLTQGLRGHPAQRAVRSTVRAGNGVQRGPAQCARSAGRSAPSPRTIPARPRERQSVARPFAAERPGSRPPGTPPAA
jgi:hypothetical protein